MSEIFGANLLFKNLWDMDLEGSSVSAPTNERSVLLLRQYVMNLLAERHIFNFRRKIVIQFRRNLTKITIRVVHNGTRLLDHNDGARLNRKFMFLFLLLFAAALGCINAIASRTGRFCVRIVLKLLNLSCWSFFDNCASLSAPFFGNKGSLD